MIGTLADEHRRFDELVPLLLGLYAFGRPLVRALESVHAPGPARTPASEPVVYALLGVASLTLGLERRLRARTGAPATSAAPPATAAPRRLLR